MSSADSTAPADTPEPHVSGRRVHLIGRTEFLPVPGIDWQTDADGGQALAEFAGRACYETWDKPNPATATNAGYLRHILDVGHLAVLEHGTATLYITGISRSVSHELTRHRHFSYSQLSQRHPTTDVVEPELIAASPELHRRFVEATEAARNAYTDLLDSLEHDPALDSALQRKQARQAARSVLPNATRTSIVVTGNYRAWRHFIGMRGTEAADHELRGLAIDVLTVLRETAPHVFADFRVSTLADGSTIAASPLVGEG
ncbi:FAD-dependent thymidylate synthase [Nakamurella silvestris]|nr:FAD-dependent thymidylate synthase [Nakamurella silvestris]